MNAIARQCHLEGQYRGEEEMASTVAQVEQFADALYREAFIMQDEYAGQLSIVSCRNDDLSRRLLGTEEYTPRLATELQTSVFRIENAMREVSNAHRANQQLEAMVRTSQGVFDQRNEEYELSKAAIQTLRDELRLHQRAAITDQARTQTEMASAVSVLQSRVASRENEMLVCFEEKQRLLEAAHARAQRATQAEEMKAITATSECVALTRGASQDATSYAHSVRRTVGAIEQVAKNKIAEMGLEYQALQ